MSLQDQIKNYVDNAPVREGGGKYVQYGELSCKINVLTWQGKGQAPIKTPYKDGMELEKGKQAMEIEFSINVKELNPSLEFEDWTRRTLVERSSDKIKTDWTETVLPSLELVFGKDWVDVVSGKKSFYVECEQADSQVPPKEGKKDYGVPRFLRKFKNIEACKAARDERFGKEEDADEEIGIPSAVVEQAKGLLKSLKGNTEKLRTMLESKPFGNYDPDAIIAELEEA